MRNSTTAEPTLIALGNNLQLYLNLIVLVIGNVGNPLSIVVCLQPRMRCHSTYRWLAVLALFDWINNWSLAFWFFITLGFKQFSVESLCKIRHAIAIPAMVTSSWIVVMISIERVISILLPMKVHIFARKFSTFGIPAVILFGCLFSPLGYTSYGYDKKANICISDSALYDLTNQLWSIFYSYIPLLLILILNTILVAKMIIMQRGVFIDDQISNAKRREMKVAKMVVLVTFFFFILTAPAAAVQPLFKKQAANPEKDPCGVYGVYYFIFLGILIPVTASNQAINIFFYCLCGSHFRNQLLKVLSIRRAGGRSKQYVIDKHKTNF